MKQFRLLALMAAALLSLELLADELSTLTSISAIKSLSVAEAAQKRPVRLRAVVTYANPAAGDLFVQDDTGAVYLSPSELAKSIAAGDLVEIEGHTDPGDFLPIVIPSQIRRVGKGDLPEPQAATVQMLVESRGNARRVVIEGVVYFAGSVPGATLLNLLLPDGPVVAILYGLSKEQLPTDLQGSRVRLSGISFPVCDQNRQVVNARVQLTAPHEFQVLPIGRVDLAALSVTPVKQLRQSAPIESAGLPTCIRGTVTAVSSPTSFYLQDESCGVLVRSILPVDAPPGTRFELWGYPGIEGGAVVFPLGMRFEIGRGDLPPPVEVTPDMLAGGQHRQRRVTFEAKVLAVTRSGVSDDFEVALQFGAAVVVAKASQANVSSQNLTAGSRVRICGVFEQRVQSGRSLQGIDIYLTRADDLAILAGPPPDPTRTLLAVLGVVGGLGGLAFLWSFTLQRRVQARTAELHGLTEAAQYAIMMMDPRGAIRYWNPAAERILGYSAEEALGKNLHELLAPERYLAAHRAAFPEFIRSGTGRAVGTTLEWFARRRDGHEIPVSVSLSAVLLSGGWHAVGILTDITERQQMEESLRAAKQHAEIASAAKSEFLANMSHEIRTPLNGVIGMTGLLIDTGLDGEPRRYAETIRSSGEALLALVNDILDVSKIEAGKLKLENVDFDLRDLLESFAAPLAMRAGNKGIEFRCGVDPDVPSRFHGDSGRLRQILTNLAGNAFKFTEQGHVSLQASLISETAIDTVVRFAVRDTGIGISIEQQKRLFQKFSQAHTATARRYGGTGLGLAISKQLVELMGGAIGVTSETGVGSEFSFTVRLGKPTSLPDGEETGITSSPSRIATDLVSRKGARILVAEDNIVNQEVALGILRKLEVHADAVADGVEVIEALKTIPYDLILMDVQMPDMDGLEATRRIRDPQSAVRNHQIPIVAMTAAAMQGDRERCLEAGMNGYVTKPISPQTLVEALNAWLPEKIGNR